MNFNQTTFAFILSFFLVSCSQQLSNSPGSIYSESVAQLGALPVYPAREDMQVGDIYIVESNPKDIFSRKTVYLNNINMTDEIKKYLKSRYKFASTVLNNDKDKIQSTYNDIRPNTSGDKWADTHGDFTTLPIAVFPTIEVHRGASASFGGTVLGDVIGAIFGADASKSLRMSLSFDEVRTYSVPITVALSSLYDYCDKRTNSNIISSCYSSSGAKLLNYKYAKDELTDSDATKSAFVILINKIYLARVINYSFKDAALVAALVKTAESKDGGSLVDALTDTNGNSVSNSIIVLNNTSDGTGVGSADATDLKATIDKILKEKLAGLQLNKGIGRTLGASVSAFNSESVTINVTLQRPVVIGYEAVHLKPLIDESKH